MKEQERAYDRMNIQQPTHLAGRRYARGVSLIELMFSLFIMSVGILGISGLQAISLQQNRSALMRSEAVQLGNDIVDRIRANPTGTYAPIAYDTAPSAGKNCIANTCTKVEMAIFDIAQWKCALNRPLDGETYPACDALGIEGSLPDGEGAIEESLGVYQVSVRWVDDRNGNTSSISLRMQVD